MPPDIVVSEEEQINAQPSSAKGGICSRERIQKTLALGLFGTITTFLQSSTHNGSNNSSAHVQMRILRLRGQTAQQVMDMRNIRFSEALINHPKGQYSVNENLYVLFFGKREFNLWGSLEPICRSSGRAWQAQSSLRHVCSSTLQAHWSFCNGR